MCMHFFLPVANHLNSRRHGAQSVACRSRELVLATRSRVTSGSAPWNHVSRIAARQWRVCPRWSVCGSREVTAVAGSNGPSGNQGAIPLHITASPFTSLFWPICSFRLFSALLIPTRTGIGITVCTSHSRSLGRSFVFEVYYQPICTIQLRSHRPMAPKKIIYTHPAGLSWIILNTNQKLPCSRQNMFNLASLYRAEKAG